MEQTISLKIPPLSHFCIVSSRPQRHVVLYVKASSLINAMAFDEDYVIRQRQIRNAKQIERLVAAVLSRRPVWGRQETPVVFMNRLAGRWRLKCWNKFHGKNICKTPDSNDVWRMNASFAKQKRKVVDKGGCLCLIN